MYQKYNLNDSRMLKKEKYILYVNSIGKEADDVLQEVISRVWLFNPRIVKTVYGRFQVTRYSFELSDLDAIDRVSKAIKNMCHIEFSDKVQTLSESRKNLYIINRIKF